MYIAQFTIDILTNLIERNAHSERVMSYGAENTKNEDLELFFKNVGRQRDSFRRDLAEAMKDYGGLPINTGDMEDRLKEMWLMVQERLYLNDDTSYVETAFAAEKKALENYQEAVSDDQLNPGLKSLLSRHLESFFSTTQQLEIWIQTLKK